ncbi:hypothetical protein MTP03_44310 [Tsukamurella sp. PLM1]|nr:hypothetical protein MTP03_44310 [Tsukamurella sp. PLM1]
MGDSYHDALAETINGLYKTELIKPRKPWKSVEQVEYGTAEWVDWFNHRRPYEYCGDIPPAELEAAYYAARTPNHQVPVTDRVSLRTHRGGSDCQRLVADPSRGSATVPP